MSLLSGPALLSVPQDTNFQKILGCIPDTIGVVTQFLALLDFVTNCYYDMPLRDSRGNVVNYKLGWGYLSYVFCWAAALIRVVMHFCTPVPGGGVGCQLLDLTRGDIIDDREISIELRSSERDTHVSRTQNRSVRPPSEDSPDAHDRRKSDNHPQTSFHAVSPAATGLVAESKKRKSGRFSSKGDNQPGPESFTVMADGAV